MSAGLHPTIMLDLVSSTAADRRRSERDRDQRAAGRRLRTGRGVGPALPLIAEPAPGAGGPRSPAPGVRFLPEPAQPVVSEVSSTRKLVAAEESSTPRNLTVTVLPA